MIAPGNFPLSWWSKVNPLVTLSTTHSELVAAAWQAKEAMFITKLFEEMGMHELVRPITLYTDNKGAASMAYDPGSHGASKHIRVQEYYARELVEEGVIQVGWIDTNNQIADMFTKPLGGTQLRYLTTNLVHQEEETDRRDRDCKRKKSEETQRANDKG